MILSNFPLICTIKLGAYFYIHYTW
uniref:Uncharacterized protein n=1 Tax=Rhizophora mucronata TaxID=61149 RepID=A0A2P2N5K3_RHIMU